MAKFDVDGIEQISLSMQELAEIPDEVKDRMLEAGADVVVRAQKRKIRQYRIYDTGTAQRSIKKGRPQKSKDGERVIYVKPTGIRIRGKEKISETSNAEILFVNEYGKRGKKARPALRDANEACAEEMVNAEFAVYDAWLKSKNL